MTRKGVVHPPHSSLKDSTEFDWSSRNTSAQVGYKGVIISRNGFNAVDALLSSFIHCIILLFDYSLCLLYSFLILFAMFPVNRHAIPPVRVVSITITKDHTRMFLLQTESHLTECCEQVRCVVAQ